MKNFNWKNGNSKRAISLFIALCSLFIVFTACDNSAASGNSGGNGGPVVIGDFSWTELDGEITITGYTGFGTVVDIPSQINGLPVTAIGVGAFYAGVSENLGDPAYNPAPGPLTQVTIPNSVITIGDFAFYYNQLTQVTIGTSVTYIGDFAFAGNQLAGVTIPNSVTSIGEEAFMHNRLASITIGSNVILATGSFPSFGHDFESAYNNGGRLAGTYTRPDTWSTIWTRQL